MDSWVDGNKNLKRSPFDDCFACTRPGFDTGGPCVNAACQMGRRKGRQESRQKAVGELEETEPGTAKKRGSLGTSDSAR